MRIHILSDLHIEFATYEPAPLDVDVVVLAGDIGLRERGVKWAESAFKCPVLYVPGNHEFYGGHLVNTVQKMRDACGDKVRVMDFDEVILGGVRFLGVTGWTDYSANGHAERDMTAAQFAMNDFRTIRTDNYRRIRPSDLRHIALEAKRWLEERLATPFAGKTVVITHHAPSLSSLLGYGGGTLSLESSYANRWDHMFDQGVDLWIHGHSHASVDYMSGGTRVVSNTRGYPDEDCGFDPRLVISI